VQQKSHTNNSVKQILSLSIILEPKVLNGEEYFGIMSDVIITNIPSQSLKCVTIFSKLQTQFKRTANPAQILKPKISIQIDDQENLIFISSFIHQINW